MPGELLARVRAEIDVRREELRPALAEYERLLSMADVLGIRTDGAATPARGRAGATTGRRAGAATGRQAGAATGRRARAQRDAAQQAIVAALEHGSHTVSELAVVTALAGPSIRENLRRLMHAGTVTRTERDGRAAYTLAGATRG